MAETLIIGDKIGGQPKQKYWTPDGREILSAPSMRGTSDGGVRDANYDKGWLPTKPTELKLYCGHCDTWHDTQDEIKQCGAKIKALNARYMKWAKRNVHPDDGAGKDKEINSLKKQIEKQNAEMSEIKELLNKLVTNKKARR